MALAAARPVVNDLVGRRRRLQALGPPLLAQPAVGPPLAWARCWRCSAWGCRSAAGSRDGRFPGVLAELALEVRYPFFEELVGLAKSVDPLRPDDGLQLGDAPYEPAGRGRVVRQVEAFATTMRDSCLQQ